MYVCGFLIYLFFIFWRVGALNFFSSFEVCPSRLHSRTKMVIFLFFDPKREIKTGKNMLFNMCKNIERLSEDSGTRGRERRSTRKKKERRKSQVMATSVMSPAASCLSCCPVVECHTGDD